LAANDDRRLCQRGLDDLFHDLPVEPEFQNMAKDNRVSIAVSGEAGSLGDIKAVYAGAYAAELQGEADREKAWAILMERHPNLADFGLPDDAQTALMQAKCKHVSMLDYSKGIGHSEDFTVEDSSAA
jgi:hypothetical protein